MAVLGGGLEVGPDLREVFGSGEGAHGAGYFLPDFAHPDFLFGGVVGEWDVGVVREFEVVIQAPIEAAGQGSVFAAECTLGVGRGEQGMPDQGGLLGDGVGIHGLVGVPGGGVVQGEQRPGDLIGPAPGGGVGRAGVVVGDGL